MMLQDYFYYDEESPSGLRWNTDRYSGKGLKIKNVSEGDVAGSIGSSGYYSVRYLGRLTLCHEIVVRLHGIDLPESHCVDHIDGNKTNNSISNLRVIERKLNCRNSKLRKDNTSGSGGVYRLINTVNGKEQILWRATWVDLNGKLKNKSFSVSKYGEEKAKKLAIDYRNGVIDYLNSLGAGYTLRHNT